jgi:hypothetical protein
MNDNLSFSRRRMVGGGLAFGLLLLGCSKESSGSTGSSGTQTAGTKMTMYKDPSCGCCGKWADAARSAGFDVSIVPTPDVHAVKAKLGVPDELVSCHTTIAGKYVVEGHVPLDAVKRLLQQRPNIKGIAVPGMPLGSPGMEVPSGAKQPFEVFAFGGPGKISVFQS